jgi:cytochrome c-type biogenesis protein CcmF
LVFFTGGALTLFAARSSVMEARGVFSLVSRESAIIANNVLLAVSCFVVFIGTMWPMFAEMFFDRTLSVGPPFFNLAFTPFMVVLGLILPFGSMLPWKRARAGHVLPRLVPLVVIAVLVMGLVWTFQTGRSLLGPVGVFLGAWLIGGAVTDLWSRTGRSRDLRRLLRLPRADWGKSVAHSGLGITMLAIAGLMAWEQEDIRVVQPGQPYAVGGWQLELIGVSREKGPNYLSTIGEVSLSKNGSEIARLFPEKRIYPVAEMPTTEAAIDYRFLRDIYVVIGDAQANGGWVVRTYIKPLASWIWGGALLMALGAALSLSDRRYRVAAGAARMQTKRVPAE